MIQAGFIAAGNPTGHCTKAGCDDRFWHDYPNQSGFDRLRIVEEYREAARHFVIDPRQTLDLFLSTERDAIKNAWDIWQEYLDKKKQAKWEMSKRFKDEHYQRESRNREEKERRDREYAEKRKRERERDDRDRRERGRELLEFADDLIAE